MNKLAISGYGKMGKEIEKLAQNFNFEIVAIIDKIDDWKTKSAAIDKSDVIIDFTIPEAALDNIKNAFAFQKPIIVGTTGWHGHLDEIRTLCEKEQGSLVYATNFSVGMNIFFEVNKHLASLMNKHADYNVAMEEIHHLQKLDSPSGTAITLAEQLITQIDKKTKWVNELSAAKDTISIISKREAAVPGTHIISYQSEIDDIIITHVAKNRQGFAVGALIGAQWIIGKKGFFNFKDVLFRNI